ncbi:hypothetical protein QBC43DRAFT_118221 [Cladorrhinum sp. PSN259]|nr:hypothetical protein QBC43DRAFT_118221 [Cladorrhinum sp. PSN259]
MMVVWRVRFGDCWFPSGTAFFSPFLSDQDSLDQIRCAPLPSFHPSTTTSTAVPAIGSAHSTRDPMLCGPTCSAAAGLDTKGPMVTCRMQSVCVRSRLTSKQSDCAVSSARCNPKHLRLTHHFSLASSAPRSYEWEVMRTRRHAYFVAVIYTLNHHSGSCGCSWCCSLGLLLQAGVASLPQPSSLSCPVVGSKKIVRHLIDGRRGICCFLVLMLLEPPIASRGKHDNHRTKIQVLFSFSCPLSLVTHSKPILCHFLGMPWRNTNSQYPPATMRSWLAPAM